MNKITFSLLAIAALLFSNTANAELLVDPSSVAESGNIEVGVALSVSSTTYEAGGGSGDVDRKMLSAYGAKSIGDELDLFGALAYTFEAELDNNSGDDNGFAFAGGLRGTLPLDLDLKIRSYAQLFIFDEDYGSGTSASGTELSFGVIAIQELDGFNVYGGVELIPFDDVELKGTSGTVDAEREDIFGLRFGVNHQWEDYLLRAEVVLVSEQGFTLSMSRPF